MAKILVVEDDEPCRKLIKRLLEREGHDVKESSDGVRGLQLLQSESFNIIISDLIIPTKEGFDVIHELKKMKSETKIIIITSEGKMQTDDTLQKTKLHGADQVIKIPFTALEFNDAIRKSLK